MSLPELLLLFWGAFLVFFLQEQQQWRQHFPREPILVPIIAFKAFTDTCTTLLAANIMLAAADRFFSPRDSEGKPTEIRYINPIVERLEFPPVFFTTKEFNHITCDEVNAFYETLYPGPNFGPKRFLQLYDKLHLAHEGNFPMPGWHTYMRANYFLEKCNLAFDEQPGFTTWKESVFMPKMGVSTYVQASDNPLKALNPDQIEEQQKPRKRGKHSEKEWNMTLFTNPKITVTEPPIDWAAIAQKEKEDAWQAELYRNRPRFPCCGEYADESMVYHKRVCPRWQAMDVEGLEKMEIE